MLNIKNLLKTAGFMIIATLLAKFAGMYRDILFASLFGTGSAAQAYLTASRIPLLFFDITLGAAVSAAFIPVYNGFVEEKKYEDARIFANSFITLVFLITGVLCVIGIIFSEPIVRLIGNDLTPETVELASRLVIVLFPSMIFTALAFSVAGLLQSLGEFNVPAAISLVSNGFMVVYLLVCGDKLGILGVSVAMLISWSFQLIIEIPALIRKKYIFRPTLNLKNEGIKKAVILAFPILISSWVQPINTTINIYLASGISNGQAVPALDYANKLYIILVGVLTYAVSNLIFPSLSRAAQNPDKTEFQKLSKNALRIICALVLPVMALFLVLSTPLVRLVYERGEFTSQSTALTASALMFYSMGMLGFGVGEITNKIFYSLKNGKTPMYVAMAGITLNILLSFVLVRVFSAGIAGLAFSASVASTIIGTTLVFIVNKRYKFLDRKFFINFFKQLVSAFLMGVVTYFVSRSFTGADKFTSKVLSLVFPGGAGFIVYIVMLCLLKAEEFRDIKNILIKSKKEIKTEEN
ncbi:MAG: murein biosynthesis integral membrane protein MurJ [Ruminococcaceae bacterium]|nr:murein biosynthesis integral membrane protein MurJ [Oscillospiraceae bacterium]